MKLSVAISGVAMMFVSCVACMGEDRTPASEPSQTAIGLPTARPDGGPLFRIILDKKVGFINRAGKVVILPKFALGGGAWVGEFHEGLAAVHQGNKTGYIDENGEFVIQPQYEFAGEFSEGVAPVQVNKKTGFINKKGEMVIPAKLDGAWGFSDGLAMFQVARKEGQSQNSYGFIDKKGDVVIKPQPLSDVGYKFVEGMFRFRQGEKFGFMDKTGKTVIDPIFASAVDFSEGMAVACDKPGQMGYIDKAGKWVLQPEYMSCGRFSEGLAVFSTEMGKLGYMDEKGHVVIKPEYFHAKPFTEGLAAVAMLPKDSEFHADKHMVSMKIVGKFEFGFIDKQNKLVIPYRWDNVEPFENGLARVHRDNKNGYINTNGKVVWAPTE